MPIVVIHSQHSKASRDFLSEVPAGTPILEYEDVVTHYPNIGGFPTVVINEKVQVIPASWQDVIDAIPPDRAVFRDLASGSALWRHIATYAPQAATLLYIALTVSSELNELTTLQEIRDMARLVANTLPAGQKLDEVQSPSEIEIPGATLDDPPTIQPIGTFADELDHWLEKSYFDWRYQDLITP